MENNHPRETEREQPFSEHIVSFRNKISCAVPRITFYPSLYSARQANTISALFLSLHNSFVFLIDIRTQIMN